MLHLGEAKLMGCLEREQEFDSLRRIYELSQNIYDLNLSDEAQESFSPNLE